MLTFSFKNCRLEFSFSCFALLAFCCVFAGYTGGAAFCLAVLLHESAHLAALFCFRAPPSSFQVSALGCRIVRDPQKPLSYLQSALVSLAGPSANLLSFVFSALVKQPRGAFAAASLGLALLHFLPVEPLDGGLALRAFLCDRMEEKTARRISLFVSLLFLVPLAVLGFFVLLRTRYNFSLLALSVYLMLYLVLKEDYLGG